MKKYRAEIISMLWLFSGIFLQSGNNSWFQNTYVLFAWYLLAFLPVGIPVLKEAMECLREKKLFNEYTLMSLASFGAFYIGEYPEGVAVMLFYSIGERFQDAAVGKARTHIRSLLDVRPDKASVLREGIYQTVAPDTVSPGEEIEIKPGERVPLDGILLTDVASFNTMALTGESLPYVYRHEDLVPAGVVVTDKVIHLRVTKPYQESTLSRILELVQNASEKKAPAELFIRKFARIYTPAVTVLAMLIVLIPYLYSLISPHFTFLFDDWFYRALVFLVISCPCALIVSIPLGYFGGIGAASRQGILFKGGNYLDTITQINAVVFDKTGTLTQGVFHVHRIHPHEVTEQELWEWIASLEKHSNHPIARAIVEEAENKQYALKKAEKVTDITGMGLSGMIDGHHILVGNIQLFESQHISYPEHLKSIPEMTILCATDNRYRGYLLLTDTVKEDAQKTISGLKNLNINNIQVYSGDKQSIVTNLAKQLGIDEAYGDLLPEEKVRHLEKLQQQKGCCVAFVGDGLNDAPVLALSNVGIAMGGLGSDAAIETADIVIQDDRPSKLLTAIHLGKQTRRIIWQNISMAFGTKIIVLLLGAGGIATLWEAVFADVGVALLAILNAMRIQYFNKPLK